VLSTVNLDDQKPFAADEIADVVEYRLLPHKFIPIDLPVTNAIPKNRLRVGLIDAQLSRDSGRLPIWPAHCLAPHPDCFAIRPLPAKSGERLSLPHQPLHSLYRRAVGEHVLCQHALADAEVIAQHALDDRAQVGGGAKIAGLVEIGGF
jgi:hypothetical protein